MKSLFWNPTAKQTIDKSLQLLNEENVVENIPDMPMFDPNQAIGREFNIITMVKEHAPKRIATIEKEVAQLEKRLQELGKEAGQLEGLVNALK